uniref:Uncharacterized protein n=1 Tax=Cacopsylla melanoneura TaxID=428564 RepID=A0A8D8S7P6_9HEMI
MLKPLPGFTPTIRASQAFGNSNFQQSFREEQQQQQKQQQQRQQRQQQQQQEQQQKVMTIFEVAYLRLNLIDFDVSFFKLGLLSCATLHLQTDFLYHLYFFFYRDKRIISLVALDYF